MRMTGDIACWGVAGNKPSGYREKLGLSSLHLLYIMGLWNMGKKAVLI